MTDLKYWVAFSRVPHIGTVRFRRLEEHFGSLEQAWIAGSGELRAAGIDDKTVRSIRAGGTSQRPSISPWEAGEMSFIPAEHGKLAGVGCGKGH